MHRFRASGFARTLKTFSDSFTLIPLKVEDFRWPSGLVLSDWARLGEHGNNCARSI